MKSGLWLKVVEYEKAKKIKIQFEESGFEAVVEAKQIRARNIEDALSKYPQSGQRYIMKNGNVIEVVEYRSSGDIDVRFIDTGFKTTVERCQINRGTIQDLLKPSYFGVGILGVGPHRATKPDGGATWVCCRWSHMIQRCTKPKVNQPTYADCTFEEDWTVFQNFAEWAVRQKGYEEDGWHLDKDVLVKGNKLYSWDTCVFLPQELNSLLVKGEAMRGNLPIGVGLQKSNGKFVVHVHGMLRSGYVGIYDTVEEAFANYKRVKEQRVKEQANKWRDKIDPRAYEALMSYQVEITD
jgi:hypothetical protein